MRASISPALPAKTRQSPSAAAAVIGQSTDHAEVPSFTRRQQARVFSERRPALIERRQTPAEMAVRQAHFKRERDRFRRRARLSPTINQRSHKYGWRKLPPLYTRRRAQGVKLRSPPLHTEFPRSRAGPSRTRDQAPEAQHAGAEVTETATFRVGLFYDHARAGKRFSGRVYVRRAAGRPRAARSGTANHWVARGNDRGLHTL